MGSCCLLNNPGAGRGGPPAPPAQGTNGRGSDMDNLMSANKQMGESVTRLGVPHSFEIYEGNHGNRVKERFETKVLPFFSEHLKAPAGK